MKPALDTISSAGRNVVLYSPPAIQALMRIGVLILASTGCSDSNAAKPPAESSAVTKTDANDPTAAHDTRYPARWWERVSKEGAPSWEILPQEAGPGEVILSKRQPDLGLLSNFAATPFEFHGKKYASLEGLWQSMKFPEGSDDSRAKLPGVQWKFSRDEVGNMTAFDAKNAGDLGSENMKKMGINWVTFDGKQIEYKPKQPGEHYRLIVEATEEKVRQNPAVKAALLSTGDLVLKPDHHQEADAPAAWHYFDILMQIRSELQRNGEPK